MERWYADSKDKEQEEWKRERRKKWRDGCKKKTYLERFFISPFHSVAYGLSVDASLQRCHPWHCSIWFMTLVPTV